MGYSRYDDMDAYWDRRWRRAVAERDGFPWGVLILGVVIGAIIF